MYIVAHHVRHNPEKEYEYSHQHQTFDSACLVFISMKYFVLVSRPKLGYLASQQQRFVTLLRLSAFKGGQ